MTIEDWTSPPKYQPERCSRPFYSDTYVPKFGDIIHCTNSSDRGNPCVDAFVVVGSGKRGVGIPVLEVLCISRPGFVSVCNISFGSAWHLAEAYVPEEE